MYIVVRHVILNDMVGKKDENESACMCVAVASQETKASEMCG